MFDDRKEAREARQMAQEAEAKGYLFPLAYHTDKGTREVQAFLIRHRNDDGSPDDFTVHLAETGEFLGEGDTKADAVSDAQGALHQWVDFGIPYNGSEQTVARDPDQLRMPGRPEEPADPSKPQHLYHPSFTTRLRAFTGRPGGGLNGGGFRRDRSPQPGQGDRSRRPLPPRPRLAPRPSLCQNLNPCASS